MRHHGTPKGLLQRLTESGQCIHRDVLATVLFGKAFGVEDALITHPSVILHPQADDVDRQLVGVGMKLLGQIARRAAASLLAVGKNDDETWLVAEVEHIGRLRDRVGERRSAGGLKASIDAMMRSAAFGVGLRSRRMVHWFQAPEPYVISPTRRKRVTLGRISRIAVRTLSMRGTLPALSLP